MIDIDLWAGLPPDREFWPERPRLWPALLEADRRLICGLVLRDVLHQSAAGFPARFVAALQARVQAAAGAERERLARLERQVTGNLADMMDLRARVGDVVAMIRQIERTQALLAALETPASSRSKVSARS